MSSTPADRNACKLSGKVVPSYVNRPAKSGVELTSGSTAIGETLRRNASVLLRTERRVPRGTFTTKPRTDELSVEHLPQRLETRGLGDN